VDLVRVRLPTGGKGLAGVHNGVRRDDVVAVRES